MVDEVTRRRIRSKKNTDLKHFIQKEVMAASRNYGTHSNTRIPHEEEAQIQMAMRESLREYALVHGSPPSIGKGSGSGAASCTANHQTKIDRFCKTPGSSSQAPFDIDLARSRAQGQPRVDVMLTGGAREKLGKAWAKWFHANDIPRRKADCPYFRAAVKLSQELGGGVHIPRGKEIDGPLLDRNYDDVEAHLAEFKEDWKEYGVTIMCDSWTGPTMMSIINFMIFCNGRMFFHKTVDATGCIQNSDFIYNILKEVVVVEVGIECVVQIVTDNGSNYKKACRLLIAEYSHITWQPCAAHTINLMLKDLGRFPLIEHVVDSAKKICRFFYNHNRLHAMMKEKIGELIRWNATRFGMVYLFLQSFWDRKDQFKLWMASKDWEECAWAGEEDHEYIEACLSQKNWWSDVELVLKAVSPIYTALRFADQQKNATISGFLEKATRAVRAIKTNLSDRRHKDLLDSWMQIIDTRLHYLLNNTLMVAAAALDPKTIYTSSFSRSPKCKHAVTLALKKLAHSSSKASAAIDQYVLFRKQGKLFGGEEARRSAINGRVSAADWWDQYGGDYPDLQYFAKRIVSQCLSSSGCERNWSTFALVHTKLRNCLSYDKLHKLVYVHYNLKLRIQLFEEEMQSLQDMQCHRESDSDPCSILMDCAMYDESNPIMDWLCNSRSESAPTLVEYVDSDLDLEPPNPSTFIIEELGMDEAEVAAFKNLNFPKKSGKKRRLAFEEEEEDIADDVESESPQGSPVYVESGDSSSDDSGGDNGAENTKIAPLHPRSKRLRKVSCFYTGAK